MALNPNWPVVEYAWGPNWNANGGTVPSGPFVDVTARTRSSQGVRRGRQYELDQVRSGEYSGTWSNTAGDLDPLNSGGPWYGHVQPYQPVRVRAQWPPTVNMLTQVQATGGDLGGFAAGAIPSAAAVTSDTDGSGGTITASGTAWQGATVLQFSVPSGTVANKRICSTNQPACKPGTTYTVQLRVRDVTASTTLQVKAYFGFYTAGTATVTSTVYGSSSTLTGSASASWTQITATATAPSTAAGMDVGVVVAGTAAATCSIQVDGWQLEQAGSASTWVQPGVTYPLYAGFLERLPSSWTLSGTYGLTQPTAVDGFSLFSQRVLRDPLTEEIYSHNPRYLYTLADPQGSNTFADATGSNPPAPIGVSKYGAGGIAAGSQITATDTVNGTYTGSSGTVVTFTPSSAGTAILSQVSYISLGSVGITGPVTTSWTRMIAFRYTGATPTLAAIMWSCMDSQRANDNPSGSRLEFGIGSDSNFSVYMDRYTDGTGVTFTPHAGALVVDGNWHLAMASYDKPSATMRIQLDATVATYPSFDPTLEPQGFISNNIGSFVDATVGNGTVKSFQGDISFVGEFSSALTATDMSKIYSAWKNSFTGDSSNARYARILGWAGYTGPTSLQAGLTTSMGAAATGGQDALSALQAVVDTESGAHYVDRSGVVTLKARSDRYNKITPTYVLGERTDLGEIPYEEIVFDYDPTRLANQVKVTQASTSQVFSAQDQTSIPNFFPRQLTRTVNSSNAQECQDAANYLLSRYKNPAVRISSVKLHPAANPSVLWPVCLSLELGTRIRVMRRPPAPAAPISVDCFVENISWEFSDQGEAWATLQCSPVDLTPYGIFASFHTTLNGSPASGVTTITINAGADNTNPANTQIGQGQQLVLGQNTANQETVTVLSVGATSPGWTTAVITLQAATTKSHTSGDVVCEPLPAGVTDPTTWDASARFDSMTFAY